MRSRAFRRALVGVHVDAGNALDGASLFMIHAKVDAAMEADCELTTEQSRNNMNNPSLDKCKE